MLELRDVLSLSRSAKASVVVETGEDLDSYSFLFNTILFYGLVILDGRF